MSIYMPINKNTSYKGMIALLIVMVVCVTAAYSYMSLVDKAATENIYQTLNELREQQRFNLYTEVKSDISRVKNFALIIENSYDKQEIINLLSIIMINTNYDKILIVGKDGIGISQDEEIVDISDRYYLQDVFDGKTIISKPVLSKFHNDMVTAIASPIYDKKGDISGAVAVSYRVDKLKEVILPAFSGAVTAYIVDSESNLLFTNAENTENYKTFIDNASKSYKVKEERTDAYYKESQTKLSGFGMTEINGQKTSIGYAPVGIDDWNIIIAADYDVIARSAIEYKQYAGKFTAVVVVSFGFLFLYEMNNASKQKRYLKKLATIDPLTKLSNRLDMEKNLKDLFDKSIKTNKNLSILMVDVDHFKAINDTYGHPAGDATLCTVADVLRKTVTHNEAIIARIGGEEFLVAMLNKDEQELRDIAYKFINKIRETDISVPDGSILNVRASVGGFTFKGEEQSVEDLYNYADRALYVAKETGRDKYISYNDIK